MSAEAYDPSEAETRSLSPASILSPRNGAQQGQVIPIGWKPTRAEPVPVVRCTGTTRSTGKRCNRWSLRGTTVCIKHGGQLPDVQTHAAAVVEAARLRLVGLTDEAIDQLEDLMTNATAEGIRLKAAQDVLDRAGVRGGIEIDIQVSETETASQRIAARLQEIAKRNARLTSTIEDLDEDENENELTSEYIEDAEFDVVDIQEEVNSDGD